jgi:glycosyltransferase involved in cell wall biosynthesis
MNSGEPSGFADKPLRVALFTDTFTEVNGAAHTLRKVADTFEALGLPLDVYCYGEDTGVQVRGSVRILSFDHKVSTNYYEKLRFECLPDPRIGRQFRRAQRTHPYDLVHLATPGSLGLAGRSLALRNFIPVVGTYHTHLADYVAMRSLRPLNRMVKEACWKFMRWFYAPCRWLLCPTDDVVAELQRHQFGNPMGVFTRGVDTQLFHVDKRSRRDNRVVTSYVGRCAPEKRVEVIPEITRDVDTDLWIVGNGPTKKELEVELPRARFTGYLFGENLAQAYADSDVLLFPSLTDTFGNVVLEAMASGVVPIVADGPGPSSFVEHGKNALICSTVRDMRDSLVKLCHDHDMRNRMRGEARAFAEKRDWTSALRGLLDYYYLAVQ